MVLLTDCAGKSMRPRRSIMLSKRTSRANWVKTFAFQVAFVKVIMKLPAKHGGRLFWKSYSPKQIRQYWSGPTWWIFIVDLINLFQWREKWGKQTHVQVSAGHSPRLFSLQLGYSQAKGKSRQWAWRKMKLRSSLHGLIYITLRPVFLFVLVSLHIFCS